MENAIYIFGEVSSYMLMAVFLQNTIFSRSLGASTGLVVARNNYNVFVFGGMMTFIMLLSSLISCAISPLVEDAENKYYITPFIYTIIIAIAYVITLFMISLLMYKKRDYLLKMVHASAFNCAVLGSLLLANNMTDLSLGGHLGFALGSGIGFILASFLTAIVKDKLYNEYVPISFRGFPLSLIFLGILSISIYGLIGHELPF